MGPENGGGRFPREFYLRHRADRNKADRDKKGGVF